ncbi:D-alanyl-D-alanine carboxypeptidase family protein, partial [Marinobacter sp.]
MALNKAFRAFSAVLLLILLPAMPVAAQAVLIPSSPQIAASSYILMDPLSGRIIMEENSHERLPPASLTKMMTAYIVERELDEGRISLSDMVPISVNAWRTEGSRTFVKEGTEVSVENLLKGVIIQSGNDASVALAEYIAGSEGAFVDIMNQQAQILGMNESSFANATGLPAPDHFSTAYDLALLAKAIINDYPENYPLYAQKHFTYNNIRQPNRNSLLWRDDSVDGLKTGHTEEAGYCLVA